MVSDEELHHARCRGVLSVDSAVPVHISVAIATFPVIDRQARRGVVVACRRCGVDVAVGVVVAASSSTSRRGCRRHVVDEDARHVAQLPSTWFKNRRSSPERQSPVEDLARHEGVPPLLLLTCYRKQFLARHEGVPSIGKGHLRR